MSIYRFYLTIGSTETEVFPRNFLSTSLVDEQKDNEAFYRRVFQGSLVFTNNPEGDDFDLLYAAEQIDPCSKILLEIERDGVYYWNGYFSTTDGDFNLDHCTFEVIPMADDDYLEIYNNYDIQYNMLAMTDPSTGNPLVPVTTTAYIEGVVNQAYTRNRWLIDIIEYLCDAVIPGATVASDFFTDDPNYVTLNDNRLLYLTIAQKSDIIRPNSTDPATVAMISLKEMLDILWIMFQVQWDYDSVANEFIIEHVSYYGQIAGLDLRTQEMARNNKYSYIKADMPKYEKFYFAEADNENFVGVPIWYDSNCVNPDINSNILEKRVDVTTDLEYIYLNQNTDVIGNEGFVILCNYEDGGDYYVQLDYGALNGDVRLNMHLSWANLHNCYYRHNRVLIEGYIANNLLTFWSAQKTKQQECYAIVCPADTYDPADYITTELGETWFGGEKAKVKRSALNPNGEMKFDLLYGPDDNVNTGVANVKTILFVQVGVNHIHAYLSEPSDGNYDLLVTETMYDDTCTLNCTGVAETWTINLGERSSSFTLVDLCHTFDAGWSIELNIDVSAMVGWESSFQRDPTVNYHDLCP